MQSAGGWQHWAVYPSNRLLHSLSLVAIGLNLNGVWDIGWHHPFVIGWSKYRLGLPSAPLNYGLMWPVWIPTVWQAPVTVSLHCPNGRQLPAVRAVQWDCERVTNPSNTVSRLARASLEGFIVVNQLEIVVARVYVNSSSPGQNGRHFADDIFSCIFVNEKFCILIKISLKFVPKGPIDNNPSLI